MNTKLHPWGVTMAWCGDADNDPTPVPRAGPLQRGGTAETSII